jgi:uncharacterized protein (TIGR01244 family)
MWTNVNLRIALTFAILMTTSVTFGDDGTDLKDGTLGATRNVTKSGKNLLCGQPSKEDFAEAKKRGIKVVISLRESSEIDWDEAAAVRNLGLEFHQLSFQAPDTLTDEVFDRALKILSKSDKSPVLLHCGSANRVGAVWLVHRVVNDGISLQDARKEATAVGLRTAGYEEKALSYIKRRAKK